MPKPINPFVYGGPVDNQKFIGRNNEIGRIFDQLKSHALGSVAIIGERRIGKTSLLHYVSAPDVIKEWNLNQEKSFFIFQDCGEISPFTITRFWQVVIKNLYYVIKRKATYSHLAGQVEGLLGKSEITSEDIKYLLYDFHEAGRLIILMLDEFEWCVRTDIKNENTTRNLLAGLRALINNVPRVFSTIIATRSPLDEVCRDVRFMGSPFYNNFVFVHLHPFSQKEAELLLKQMLADTNLTFTQTEKEIIYGLAGTHPLLLQVAAALVFDYKVSGAAQAQDFVDIRMQFHDLVRHQFEDYWKWSQPKMRQVLVYLACCKNAEAIELLEAWTNERETLKQRGLIVKQGDTYRLFSPTFKEWLINNFYRLDVSEWIKMQDILDENEVNITTSDSPTVFISYSHKDEAEKEALLVQLGVLQYGTGLIDLWCDDRIGGGEDWEKEISESMKRARIAILLISANFLTSRFILNNEMPKLLQRQKSEGLKIIPLIAKHCAWRNIEWLAKMNVRPKNGNPVWRENGIYADEELATIAEEVARIMKGADR